MFGGYQMSKDIYWDTWLVVPKPSCNEDHRNVVLKHEQCISVPKIIAENVKLWYTPAVGSDKTNNN